MVIIVLILTVTSTVGATMGFGLAVLSLPFITLFADIKILVPMLGTIGTIASAYLSFRNRQHIQWRELRRIMMWCLFAFPLGLFAFHFLPMGKLNILFGIFIIVVSLEGLWDTYRIERREALNPLFGRFMLLVGGFIHGAFTTGGPAIVAYAEGSMRSKEQFRATLLCLWALMNPIFLAVYFISSSRQMAPVWMSICCLPAIVIGTFLGQRIHSRVSEKIFRRVVFAILLLGGISRLFPQ